MKKSLKELFFAMLKGHGNSSVKKHDNNTYIRVIHGYHGNAASQMRTIMVCSRGREQLKCQQATECAYKLEVRWTAKKY